MNNKRTKRIKRVRSKISGTSVMPRATVYRTNKYIYGQIIDDSKGKTLVSHSSKKLDKKNLKDKNKTETAFLVGQELATLAKKKKISKIVFDRGGYKYHGRVKAFADGMRKGGLSF